MRLHILRVAAEHRGKHLRLAEVDILDDTLLLDLLGWWPTTGGRTLISG